MTDADRMAVAALRMLMEHSPKDDHVAADLVVSTIFRHPELRFFYFDDNGDIVKAGFYADRYAERPDEDDFFYGSFEEGFKRLEVLIDGQK